MNKSEFKAARKLIRSNGLAALAWIAPSHVSVMRVAMRAESQLDAIAYRAKTRKPSDNVKTLMRLFPTPYNPCLFLPA